MGQRAVIMDVHKQPGYNINQTVAARKGHPAGPARHAAGLRFRMRVSGRAYHHDFGASRRRCPGHDGHQHRALVVLVMFVFLRHASATADFRAVTIPVSLLSTCAVMYLLNYTIDKRLVDGADDRGRLHHR